MGWLLKKVANRVEEKVPGSADAIETIKSDATTGESHAFVAVSRWPPHPGPVAAGRPG